MLNLSNEAVQVACETRYALLIHPDGVAPAATNGRLLDISIAIPVDGGNAEVKARCRVKYCVKPAAAPERDEMILGLQFVRMDFTSIQHLDHLVDHTP